MIAAPLSDSATPLSDYLNQFNLIAIVYTYMLSLKVHTDQGRNFDSTLVRKLSNLLGIQKTRTTPLYI